jgi:hypothetical protein
MKATRPLILFAAILYLLFTAPEVVAAQSAGEPLCRLGVNIFKERPSRLALEQLRLSWYLDGWANTGDTRPNNIEYVLAIQIDAVAGGGYRYQPSGAALDAAIAAHPGASWLIGNEPDRRHYQNDLLPEMYAAAYHELYAYLKSRDPAARVLAGSIVQATPLRLEYLDSVLAAYQDNYAAPLPADGWNIHNFILNERSCDYYQDLTICWGADIPPGSDAIDGMIITAEDHDRLDLFAAQIERFRGWMHANGYRNTPLYLTEYGILMPEWMGFPATRVNTFMTATFDYLLTATDPQTGYPPDGNRLVQRMAWYAAATDQLANVNGVLFIATNPGDPEAPGYVLSAVGEHYRDYAVSLAAESDLAIVAMTSTVTPSPIILGAPVTVTLTAQVANSGNRQNATTGEVLFYDGSPAQGGTLHARVPITLAGCGAHTTVTVTIGGLTPTDFSSHRFTAVLTTINHADVNPDNDQREEHVQFASNLLYLPVLRRP